MTDDATREEREEAAAAQQETFGSPYDVDIVEFARYLRLVVRM